MRVQRAPGSLCCMSACVIGVLQEKLVNAGVPWPGMSQLSCEPLQADLCGTRRCLWQVEGVAGKCYVSLQVYIADTMAATHAELLEQVGC
jgi:hypothetical protein